MNIEASYELTPIQQGMLFHHLSSKNSGVDVEQIVGTLRENIDAEGFRQAWTQVARRHPPLRTAFRWDNLDTPVQDVHTTVRTPFAEEDWRGLSPSDQNSRLEQYLEVDRENGFDISRPPLSRVALFRTADSEYRLVWTLHHILMDGWSFPIVLLEVFDFYENGQKTKDPDSGSAAVFRDHIEWLRRRDRSGDETHWRSLLTGFGPLPSLPIEKDVVRRASRKAGNPGPPGRMETELLLTGSVTRALTELARSYEVSTNTLVQGAWAVLLSRYVGEEKVLFGATRSGRKTVEDADSIVGLFITTVPIAVSVPPDAQLGPWLKNLRKQHVTARPYEQTPLVDIQRWSDAPATSPLFDTLVVFDHLLLDSVLKREGGGWTHREFHLRDKTNFALTLYAYAEPEMVLRLVFDPTRFDSPAVDRLLGHLASVLESMTRNPNGTLGDLNLLSDRERHQLLVDWNETGRSRPVGSRVHELIETQVALTPGRAAATVGGRQMTYATLNSRANRLARHLRSLGVGPDVLVGLCTGRSVEMMVGLLGILKAGGAYLPLDPEFPSDRLAFMLDDTQAPVVITERGFGETLPMTKAQVVCLEANGVFDAYEDGDLQPLGTTEDLAYVIYTSGSTGRPKGVMVEHRNVVNFFVGMDDRVEHDFGGTWLASTSLSFDISVLELLWTLARGFTVVLASASDWGPAERDDSRHRSKPVDFSLFYFASDEGESGRDKYRLLLEGAKYADQNGFAAVWTPERHFHAFGGLYPNPSVTGAAIAALTDRVQIRAGSCVLPLHSPIRVAEEWSLVDNLSNGRVGVAFASGWQPNDFVLAPENYVDRRKGMLDGIETVRRLWRGEKVGFPNAADEVVEIQTLPRPVQPELPVWVTTAGNIDTYREAAHIGANVLTHLLGQTVEELGDKIAAYHEAWQTAGHPGRGTVTLMLHTFLGDDDGEVKQIVREPMKDYLRSAVSLVKGYASSWTAYKRGKAGPHVDADAIEKLTPAEMEGLLDYAFERYFETSGLFGTLERGVEMMRRIQAVDVDEVACLIDFGVASDMVLERLSYVGSLRERLRANGQSAHNLGIPHQLKAHHVTHLQCTPSMARMMATHHETRRSLGSLRQLLLGGEVLPVELAQQLRTLTQADILNMYGPTETTVWSSSALVETEVSSISIGRPIANTEMYVLDGRLQPVPVGVTGELFIGGAGVARGYLRRPDLTAERFIPDPFSGRPCARLYRTGDLARYRSDGTLDFLGRTDHQVKLRGHRIELGEIEAALRQHPTVAEAVVVSRRDADDGRLVAYLVTTPRESIFPSVLRKALQKTLPEYMVPSVFITLESFPMTPNRKIDRSALPAPSDVDLPRAAAFVPPSNELERTIAGVWQEVLHLPNVSIHDNFFDVGGHSLLAVQLHGRLRQLTGQDLSVTDLFRFPTVHALTRHLSPQNDADTPRRSNAERALARRTMTTRRRRRDVGRGGVPAGS